MFITPAARNHVTLIIDLSGSISGYGNEYIYNTIAPTLKKLTETPNSIVDIFKFGKGSNYYNLTPIAIHKTPEEANQILKGYDYTSYDTGSAVYKSFIEAINNAINYAARHPTSTLKIMMLTDMKNEHSHVGPEKARNAIQSFTKHSSITVICPKGCRTIEKECSLHGSGYTIYFI